MKLRYATFAAVGTALVLSTGCTPKDTKAADEQAIRDTDAKWSQSSVAKDLDGVVNVYADSAQLLPPDAPMMTGKAPVRAMWADMLKTTDKLAWKAVTVEASGDLGYVVGTYEIDVKDAQGKSVAEVGKMSEIFRRQPDGSWKAIVDMFSPDAPPPAAPAPAPAAKK